MPNLDIIVADIETRDAEGNLFAKAVEHDLPPLLIYTHRSMPLMIGERVLVRMIDGQSCKVIKKIDKLQSGYVGIFHKDDDGARLLPIDKKSRMKELKIARDYEFGAKSGDLVRVELIKLGKFNSPSAKVVEILGNSMSEKSISLIALISHDIPYIFPESVVDAAEKLKQVTMKGREDWRDLPLITIDPIDAKDHDDAVFAKQHDKGFTLYVAIADVACYVTPQSELDVEAVRRGNSVYFPDRVVPMLPEALSTDLCSLKPHVPRPAICCKIEIDLNGKKQGHSFHRIMMQSKAKVHYAQAQSAIDGETDAITAPILEEVLKPLYNAYAALKISRQRRQPLDLDLPERKIMLDATGIVTSVIIPPRLDAHKLIEEMMILANVCAAQTLEDYRLPCLYRIHDMPSFEKLLHLKDFLVTLDITLPKAKNIAPANFNQILHRAKGTPEEDLINQVILRSQAQAEYNPSNIGHFGLNLQRYAHFTSPIRRYADLLVHRGLIKAHGWNEAEGMTKGEMSSLKFIAQEISNYERRAMAAERETVDRLIAGHLAEHIGKIFAAKIAGLSKAGFFVKLDESGADGFVSAQSLHDDYYIFDEKARMLIGRKSGYSYKLGATVHVKLVEAAPAAGALRFEVVEGGEKGKPFTHRNNGKQARPKEIKNKRRR